MEQETNAQGFPIVDDCGGTICLDRITCVRHCATCGGTNTRICKNHDAPEGAGSTEATPAPMPIGPRGTVHFTPGFDGHGSSRTFRRTINGRHFSFNVVNMPNGDVRLFVKVYNGYGDRDVKLFGMTQAEADERGMQWGCAWTHLHSITIKAPVRPYTASYVVNEAGATSLRDARPMTFDDGRMVTAQVTGVIASVFVGLALHHDGPMPAGMVPGSPDFYAWCREVAITGEAIRSTFATIVFGQPHRVTVTPDQSGVEQGRYRVADVIDGRLMIVPARHLHPVNA